MVTRLRTARRDNVGLDKDGAADENKNCETNFQGPSEDLDGDEDDGTMGWWTEVVKYTVIVVWEGIVVVW